MTANSYSESKTLNRCELCVLEFFFTFAYKNSNEISISTFTHHQILSDTRI